MAPQIPPASSPSRAPSSTTTTTTTTADDHNTTSPTTTTTSILTDADIPGLLALPHCRIRQPARVASLLAAICADGPAHVHLVTDFDHTVTRPYRIVTAAAGRTTIEAEADEGDTEQPSTASSRQRIPSSFGVLGMCPSLSARCRNESLQLVRHFYPIQQDRGVPMAERVAAMLEWWRRTDELYRGERLPRAEIREAARRAFGGTALREGTVEMFGRLEELRVPVLVFSAGLADGVVAVLADTGLMRQNVQVLGNWLVYRRGGGGGGGDGGEAAEEVEADILEGFDATRVIHAFNKNEHALEQMGGGRQMWDRRNVLVMGDSLGDAEMADGAPAGGNVLKIGFLCEHFDENLEVFMDHFDIVLVDDQTMDVPRAILERISRAAET